MGKGDLTLMRYLHIVPYQNLINWSVAHVLGNDLGFTNRYPFVSIGVLLKPSRNVVIIKDNVEYKQVTVKTNGGGAVLRGIKLGKDIGTKKQYRVTEGQFIMSKIDARNGAFGIVSGDLNGAVVTGDFPVYDVEKEKLNPSYLQLLSCTKPFIKYAQSCSRGTTNRQRIDVNHFLDLQIPLPSLEEQNTIVTAYKNSISLAEQYEQQVANNGGKIKQYINTQLGIEQFTLHKLEHGNVLQFIRYKETLLRWDIWNGDNVISSKYEVVRLRKLIQQINTGTIPPTNKPEYFGGDIKFYTPSDIDGDMYLGKSERTLTQKAIVDKKARIFYKGDLLFVGIGSTVGKVGIVSDDIASSNQQITGLTLDRHSILPEFAFIYMNANKDITTAEQSKTTLPIVNQEKIKNIQIPLPPLNIQNEIVSYVKGQKDLMVQLKQRAQDARKKAIIDFETKLFV